jgi:hypothetical protein
MTEDEAKERWCPFVRLSANRFRGEGVTEHQATRCIASECMAWRWDLAEGEWSGKLRLGYCGLAELE